MKTRTVVKILAAIAVLILFSLSSVEWIAQAQTTNQAAVIVRLNEQEIKSRCVPFTEDSISGLDLISRSGLDVDMHVAGMGSAVCSIEKIGCSIDDCFCECGGGADCTYWSYWHQTDQGWRYAAAGANSYQVSPGDVDGWSWGPGSVTSAVEPPLISFEEICTLDDQPPTVSSELEAGSGSNLLGLALFSGLFLIIGLMIVQVKRRGETSE